MTGEFFVSGESTLTLSPLVANIDSITETTGIGYAVSVPSTGVITKAVVETVTRADSSTTLTIITSAAASTPVDASAARSFTPLLTTAAPIAAHVSADCSISLVPLTATLIISEPFYAGTEYGATLTALTAAANAVAGNVLVECIFAALAANASIAAATLSTATTAATMPPTAAAGTTIAMVGVIGSTAINLTPLSADTTVAAPRPIIDYLGAPLIHISSTLPPTIARIHCTLNQ